VLFAGERTAAQLLDMRPADFLALVDEGHLPRPREIGGLKRWDVEELRRIITGEAAEGMGDVRW
jgi:predicted DNA-binding transcriptional regulator AlpA